MVWHVFRLYLEDLRERVIVYKGVWILDSVKKEVGFTLIELLVSIAIISLLAAIAISHYRSYRIRVFDTAAKSDLKYAITALETYYLDNNIYPADSSDLLANGFNFSKNVCFTKYDLENAGQTVHIHIMHTASPNAWHTRYPDDGGDIDRRDTDSCI